MIAQDLSYLEIARDDRKFILHYFSDITYTINVILQKETEEPVWNLQHTRHFVQYTVICTAATIWFLSEDLFLENTNWKKNR